MIELKVEINVSQSHLKYLCKCSSYVFLGQYLLTSAENNEECCRKNEEPQQFHCKLRHLKRVFYRCYVMRDITCCHIILFWDDLDIEIKASEAYVKIEQNDGIYFRIYTEKLFLGFWENYALCTTSMKEHGIVLLQATLHSW